MIKFVLFIFVALGIGLVPSLALGQATYDCGAFDANGGGDTAVKCFETHFSICVPAMVVFDSNGENMKRTILGIKGDACEVQISFLKSHRVDFSGHEMVCALPYDREYFSRDIFAGGELARCSGDLVPAYEKLKTEMESKPSFEEIIYSDAKDPVSKSKVLQAKLQRLKGRILIATEKNGEAWYLRPNDNKAIRLGHPSDAFAVMRSNGVGISNAELDTIRLAYETLRDGTDTDGDGISDRGEAAIGTDPRAADTDGDGYADGMEIMNGYSPTGYGRAPHNEKFAKKYAGTIFLAVQRNGEAWYIHPTELRRYYLGRPTDAFSIMRKTGLGISDADFADLPRVEVELHIQ